MQERITEAQLVQIYNDTIIALYRYASRRCGGQRALAEDVTQETWLRAVKDWRQRGPPERPLGWLTTVARYLILNDLRRREPESLDGISPGEIVAAMERDAVSDSAEIAFAVNQALTRIPKAEAQLLEAFHYERSKVSQLAERYGISERAVEGRLRRARERLRRELELKMKAANGTL
jgi:RNA polymerase sigma-70 factor (ECF subfamily)